MNNNNDNDNDDAIYTQVIIINITSALLNRKCHSTILINYLRKLTYLPILATSLSLFSPGTYFIFHFQPIYSSKKAYPNSTK